MTLKKFKLTEFEWSESLKLATAPQAKREQWWVDLGAELGFDPKTVDFVRPLVFKAEPVAPSEPAPSEPEGLSGAPTSEEAPAAAPVETGRSSGSLDADEAKTDAWSDPESSPADDILSFGRAPADDVEPHVDVKVERRAESPPEPPPPAPLPGAVPPRRKPARGSRAPRTDAVIATANDGDLVQVDEVPCGRCGQKHHGVTYSKLDRPVIVGTETLTHYSWCPMTGQPMLLSIAAPGSVRVPADVERMKTDAPVDLGEDEAATKRRSRTKVKS